MEKKRKKQEDRLKRLEARKCGLPTKDSSSESCCSILVGEERDDCCRSHHFRLNGGLDHKHDEGTELNFVDGRTANCFRKSSAVECCCSSEKDPDCSVCGSCNLSATTECSSFGGETRIAEPTGDGGGERGGEMRGGDGEGERQTTCNQSIVGKPTIDVQLPKTENDLEQAGVLAADTMTADTSKTHKSSFSIWSILETPKVPRGRRPNSKYPRVQASKSMNSFNVGMLPLYPITQPVGFQVERIPTPSPPISHPLSPTNCKPVVVANVDLT